MKYVEVEDRSILVNWQVNNPGKKNHPTEQRLSLKRLSKKKNKGGKVGGFNADVSINNKVCLVVDSHSVSNTWAHIIARTSKL